MASPTLEALREEFEAQLISPAGAHCCKDYCAMEWDAELGSNLDEYQDMLDRCAMWLAGVNKTKQITKGGTSYGNKHAVENWTRAMWPKRYTYVLNGVFVMAAVRAGFRWQPCFSNYFVNEKRYGSPTVWDCHNVYFNMGRQRLHIHRGPEPFLLKEITPDGMTILDMEAMSKRA